MTLEETYALSDATINELLAQHALGWVPLNNVVVGTSEIGKAWLFTHPETGKTMVVPRVATPNLADKAQSVILVNGMLTRGYFTVLGPKGQPVDGVDRWSAGFGQTLSSAVMVTSNTAQDALRRSALVLLSVPVPEVVEEAPSGPPLAPEV